MLPTPTAEAVLLMGILAAMTQEKPRRCARITRSIADRIGAKPTRRVRELREVLPSIKTATDGAMAVLRARCAVCPIRSQCKAPLPIG